jgi:hypothetical protein
MKISQALVAIGGRATRLRAGGIDVRISKSFLTIRGKPLLHWCLYSLYLAGIREVVLAADRDIQLHEAEFVLSGLPVEFQNVAYFMDEGLGVHGLPYYARHLLDDRYIFECGHSVNTPELYRKLDGSAQGGVVAFSAFRPHAENQRYPVHLNGGKVVTAPDRRRGRFALAHPFAIDRSYGEALPALGVDIVRVIDSYVDQSRLQYVLTDMPPEFDIVPEFVEATKAYESYVVSLSGSNLVANRCAAQHRR